MKETQGFTIGENEDEGPADCNRELSCVEEPRRLKRTFSMPSLYEISEEADNEKLENKNELQKVTVVEVQEASRPKVIHKSCSAGVVSELSSMRSKVREFPNNDIIADDTLEEGQTIRRSFSLLSVFQRADSKEEKERNKMTIAKKSPRFIRRRNALNDPERMAMSQDVRERVEKERKLRTASFTRKVSLVFRSIVDDDCEVDLV